jgi:hypothetical protein
LISWRGNRARMFTPEMSSAIYMEMEAAEAASVTFQQLMK